MDNDQRERRAGDEPEPPEAEADRAPQRPSEEQAEPWPTEPPEPGSEAADTWPTAAPERGEMATQPPPAEHEPTPGEVEAHAGAAGDARPAAPPPSEVEAYAASTAATGAEDAAATAAAAHTVPPTPEVGESTKCPRCGTENRPGLAFCQSCGQRLMAVGVAPTIERPGVPEGTEACPRCGTHNRAGVAFCQNCGANLRAAATGYVPPAVAEPDRRAAVDAARGGAVLGPVVLLIGAIGLVTAWLLPFPYGSGSLFERAFGDAGYGAAFWAGYPDLAGGLADQAYFGFAAPMPLLVLLLVGLAAAGFARGAPGMLQRIGLIVALLWAVGLAVLFIVVEAGGNWGGDLVGTLRALSPAGIIAFLASLIVVIGTLTRLGRG